MNYEETIERLTQLLNDWVQTDGEDAPEGDLQTLDDAITLLKHYREGLEWLARVENVTSTNGLSEVKAMGKFARKTLEGPK